MSHHLNLREWETWLAEAREAGMWEEHPRLPDWYERDPLDELGGEPRVRVREREDIEEKKAA